MPNIVDDKTVKIIAFYLPQYHAIKENDIAWGEGFTEWTNVKKAKSLFEKHYQPKEPYNDNYYNLMDEKTQEWQGELANMYGVYGFCYYHYWFKGGKKLLEKPAEHMLENKKITNPFCFCWANEHWTRNWNGQNGEIIVEQDYGNENDYEQHFQYLLKFFRDDRYILVKGAPMLVVYKPELIPDFDGMAMFFKRRCKEEGFSGCNIVIQYPDYLNSINYNERSFDHYICFEPIYTMRHEATVGLNDGCIDKIKTIIKSEVKKILGHKITGMISGRTKSCDKPLSQVKMYSYDKVWRKIIKRRYKNEKYIAGAFVDWDNTARYQNGTIYVGATPEKFGLYMDALIKKINNSKQYPVIFLTAWNEWGEGSYLEPDKCNEYGYLEALHKSIVANCANNR